MLSCTRSVRWIASRQASSTSAATLRGRVERTCLAGGSGRRSRVRARTKYPDCGRASIRPCDSRCAYACTTVDTLTRAARLIDRTDGMRSDARSAPEEIWPATGPAIRSYSNGSVVDMAMTRVGGATEDDCTGQLSLYLNLYCWTARRQIGCHEHCFVQGPHHARLRLHLPGVGYDLPRHRDRDPDAAAFHERRRALPDRRGADVLVARGP